MAHTLHLQLLSCKSVSRILISRSICKLVYCMSLTKVLIVKVQALLYATLKFVITYNTVYHLNTLFLFIKINISELELAKLIKPRLVPLQVKPIEEEARLEGVLLWFTLAMIVGIAIGFQRGVGDAEAYFAGYLLEQSLSLDNLFVFILIFEYFKCPR